MPTKDDVTFLIVDDDEVAIMGIRRAIKKLGLDNPVEEARNGEEALDKLRAKTGGVDRPFLVTLDLNMPRMGGLQFLQEIRCDPNLQDTIIFVMTTSDAPTDITAAYEKNIAGYILKDNAVETLNRALGMLGDFSHTVLFPGDARDTQFRRLG